MTKLILASASVARQRMLTEAGVPFTVQIAAVNENSLRSELWTQTVSTEDAALALADVKARSFTNPSNDATVIGADQILDLDGAWLEKPADRDAARTQLLILRGRTHRLVSAVSAWQRGERIWQTVDTAELSMRAFTDDFVDYYIQQAGNAVLSSVGAYQLEGLGAQLFTSVRGDFFTILGMPLLPLLHFLRRQRILMP